MWKYYIWDSPAQVVIFYRQDVNPENEARVQLRMCGNVMYIKLPKLEAESYDNKL